MSLQISSPEQNLGGADKWLQQNLIFPTRYDEYATGATLKATLHEYEVRQLGGPATTVIERRR